MKTFVIADLHLNHKNILNMSRDDGTKLRLFNSLDEMHHTILERWNERVHEDDLVYVLGDVSMGRLPINLVAQLKGRKILVKGNHDEDKLSVYADYFSDVLSSKQMKKYILTHIPIHPTSVGSRINIHGHLHYRTLDDPRYICVSVERTNYYPIDFEDIKKELFK